jgi:hypothetical protein
LVATRGARKPGKIAYHSLTMYEQGKFLLIGGSNLGTDNPHIYELDLFTNEWVLDTHQKPSDIESIDEHTASLYDGKIYIFGGNVHGFKSNTMYILDVSTRKWETKECQNVPPERSSHSAVIKDSKIYVFGGKGVDNNKLGDFWVYDISNNSWSEIKVSECDGPISRSGHSSGIFRDYIIIYAGIHELTQELSDMYLYNVKSNSWAMLFEEEHSPVHQNRSINSSFSMSSKHSSDPI